MFENRDVKGIIWDLDNTLYRFNDAFIHACNIASARAAVKGGAPLGEDEALSLSQQSFVETGRSGTYFIQRHGLSAEKLHHDYHGFVDEMLIHGAAEVAELFTGTPFEHAIATHANHDWARRALMRIGLADFFPDSRIIAHETAGFVSKDEGTLAFDLALAALELEPDHVIVVEDTMRNLRVPFEMGCGTVFLHHGQVPEALPEYVDVATGNAHSLLSTLARTG